MIKFITVALFATSILICAIVSGGDIAVRQDAPYAGQPVVVHIDHNPNYLSYSGQGRH